MEPETGKSQSAREIPIKVWTGTHKKKARERKEDVEVTTNNNKKDVGLMRIKEEGASKTEGGKYSKRTLSKKESKSER